MSEEQTLWDLLNEAEDVDVPTSDGNVHAKMIEYPLPGGVAMVYIVVSDPSDPSLLNKQRAAAIESLINMATGNTGMYTRLMPSTPNEVVKNPVVVSIVQPDRVEVVTYYLDENGEIKVVYRAEEYSRWKDSVYMPATSFKWPEGPNLDMADEKDLPILTRAKELAEQFGYFAQSCLRSGGYSPA